jgi:uncharacterized protein involved in exopolysaccharide biosynthesis
MKVILASVVLAVVLGVAAALVLNSTQKPAYEAYSTSGASVRDPGHNLVGENWSGNPRPRNG